VGIFSALDDLVVTGPTRTNVNDYRVILVPAQKRRIGFVIEE
jgi:glycerate 2-kinase